MGSATHPHRRRRLAQEARSFGVDVVLGPGIEIKRSPLCGRNFEYYSEGPLLTGRLAGAMVEGLQSQGIGACVKHFTCNTQETDRLRVSVDVDVPGHPVEVPLTVWSQLGDWMAHPTAGPALHKLIQERGGIKGRLGDLLSDPVSQDSALSFPLISVTQFPGFPISTEDVQELLGRL